MDNINSVDTVQMSMVLYALKKAQSIEEDASKTLIQKTLQKIEENKEEVYSWLGKNIDILV